MSYLWWECSGQTNLAAVYEDWSAEETRNFLIAQGIKVKDSDTVQDLHKQAALHADAASTVRIYHILSRS